MRSKTREGRDKSKKGANDPNMMKFEDEGLPGMGHRDHRVRKAAAVS